MAPFGSRALWPAYAGWREESMRMVLSIGEIAVPAKAADRCLYRQCGPQRALVEVPRATSTARLGDRCVFSTVDSSLMSHVRSNDRTQCDGDPVVARA
jgi:hypothetical protein